jgi:hypothetical protein
VNRRAFIAALGGTAAGPLAAPAQQPPEVPTIGYLGPGTSSGQTQWVDLVA